MYFLQRCGTPHVPCTPIVCQCWEHRPHRPQGRGAPVCLPSGTSSSSSPSRRSSASPALMPRPQLPCRLQDYRNEPGCPNKQTVPWQEQDKGRGKSHPFCQGTGSKPEQRESFHMGWAGWQRAAPLRLMGIKGWSVFSSCCQCFPMTARVILHWAAVTYFFKAGDVRHQAPMELHPSRQHWEVTPGLSEAGQESPPRASYLWAPLCQREVLVSVRPSFCGS